MSIKEVARKVAIGIATAGLSGCALGSDPSPGPMECQPGEEAAGLTAMAFAEGRLVTVQFFRMGFFSGGTWAMATVTDVKGAELVSVGAIMGQTNSAQVVLRIPEGVGDGGMMFDAGEGPVDLAFGDDAGAPTDGGMIPVDGSGPSDAFGIPPAAQAVSFTLHGSISGTAQTGCSFDRVFQLEVFPNGGVQVSSLLPLGARQPARIAVVRRDDREVHLEARTRYRGERTVEWRVSDGEMVGADGDRMVWRPPAEPGLYQVELMVDYGDDGFALDTLTVEVA